MILAGVPKRQASGLGFRIGLRPVRQPEAGQRHAGQANAKLLQRRAPRDGLGQALGEFIELVVHTFPFILGDLSPKSRLFVFRLNMGCYPLQQENRENLTGSFRNRQTVVQRGTFLRLRWSWLPRRGSPLVGFDTRCGIPRRVGRAVPFETQLGQLPPD